MGVHEGYDRARGSAGRCRVAVRREKVLGAGVGAGAGSLRMVRGRKRGRSRTPAPASPEVEAGEAIVVDARFVASRELLVRARGRVAPEDVARYAPNDPGYPEYVAAFEAILLRGEAALHRGFAVTETIGLTRWGDATATADPARFRWFRVLTSAVEVLLDDRWNAPHYTLARLLADSFALRDDGDRAAPVDILSAVAREVSVAFCMVPERQAFCTLAELLLAGVDQLDHADIEALCANLDAEERRLWEIRCTSPGRPPRGEMSLWGLTHFDQLHPVWLDLVAARFPVEPATAAAMKQHLLAGGARRTGRRRELV